MRDDLIRLDKLSEEARLLSREKIGTTEELIQLKARMLEKRASLIDERKKIGTDRRRRTISEEEKESLGKKQMDLSKQIRALGREISLCDDVLNRSEELEKKIEMTVSVEGKEKREHERER